MVTKISEFIRFIRSECKKRNTFVEFTPWKSIKDTEDNENIEGFFQVPSRKRQGKIKIAAGVSKSTWLHTLAHEYAHFEYWKKNKSFRKSYLLDEKRTEERALELLKEWKLPINMKVRKKQSKKYLKSIEIV